MYTDFNGDVSNVTDMSWMFAYSTFNSNIGEWNVTNMTCMFYNQGKIILI